ncbi:MAG: sulfatase-like hydrolase/transferase, partial [Bacteroidota bacterium]
NSPNQQGVNQYEGHISSGVADYFEWDRTVNGTTDVSTEYATTYVTDQALDWLEEQTQPWLLWLAYNAPHSPLHLPPDSLYTRNQTSSNDDQYLCMIESVDHEVGRLYAALSPEELDNTIIIFLGDNGTPNGRLQGGFPMMHGKSTLYEGGIRVPMFVTGFGVDRVNETEDALVSFTDVFATLTELLGEDLPGGMGNSFSFLPLLSDPNGPTKTYNYSELEEAGAVNRAIRNERYKVILRASGQRELYDLLADPFEESDLVPGGLNGAQMQIMADLETEADSIFLSWSCRDGIQNGNEEGIDCGGSSCTPCNTTSVEEFGMTNSLVIYPNPVEATLNIDLPDGPARVRIFNADGRLVFTNRVWGPRFTWNTVDLLSGVYFVVVRDLVSGVHRTGRVLVR